MKIEEKRPYRQTARATAAQVTGDTILAAFRKLIEQRWYDEITLDDVAAEAGITRQTIIRRFGGKAGLLAAFTSVIAPEVEARRAVAPSDDLAVAVAVLVADYELIGDTVLRFLSLEGRLDEISPLLEAGRKGHRRWVETTFGPRLSALDETERRDRLAQLLVVTDVWSWMLLRRTQGHSVTETERLLTAMIAKLLD